VIFIDSNIPMYLVGNDARRRVDAQQLLERAIAERERLVTNAEVFQEILHRYAAIRRRDAIQPAFEALLAVVDEVYPVLLEDVERAKTLLLGGRGNRSARDAIHAATMERGSVTRIMSFDTGFDAYPGVERVSA
jgi:predicted nucleic acid-binding protein